MQTQSDTPILQLENVSYAYDGARDALRGVSLAIRQGEKIALLGGNGAGKSTFMLCCNGVRKPRAGRVLLDGAPVGTGRADMLRLRRAVGIVFQDPDNQIIAPTVEAEVSFGPMNLRLSGERVRAQTDGALRAMNLEAFRARPPHYLSGGEKKRVTIADILAMEPRLILLDEPTAGLDGAHTARLEQTLAQLHAQGIALLLSTHDTDFAWRFADRVVILADGQVVADGAARDVFGDAAALARAELQPPMLYEIARALKLRDIPKTVEELKCMIGPFSS